jgi:uncharacterized protein YndB with AHSA1/START domain
MNKIEFTIDIDTDSKKVWDVMLAPETYKQWVSKSWPGSSFDGLWKQGENIRFIGPGQGGTMATIVDLKPYEYILAKHIAIINQDGSEDRTSDVAKGWIGTTESYTFQKNDDKTKLKVEITTSPQWEKMFNDGWPGALAELKRICEGR